MTRLFALALMALALTACTGEKVEKSESESTADGKTTVSTTVNVNGHALAFHAYAMRTPPNGQTSTAAYFTVTNTGSSADRLLSVSCACARSAMLHTTTHTQGMVGMTDTPDGFPLPAGQTLVFKPGGIHVMLMGLTGALKEGDRVDLVVTFAKAGPVTLHVPVRDAPLSDDSSAAMSGMKM